MAEAVGLLAVGLLAVGLLAVGLLAVGLLAVGLAAVLLAAVLLAVSLVSVASLVSLPSCVALTSPLSELPRKTLMLELYAASLRCPRSPVPGPQVVLIRPPSIT
jgi:hypothetical protein